MAEVRVWLVTCVLVLSAVLVGCEGLIGLGGGTPQGANAGGTQAELIDGRLRQRVWRLTPEQYLGEIRRIFGADTPDLGKLLPGGALNGFDNTAALSKIDEVSASDTFNLAAQYAESLAAKASTVTGCPAATFGKEECAAAFIDRVAPLAFRRPLSADERNALLALHREGAAIDFATGIGAVVHSILASPNFLYRTELGDGGSGTSSTLTQFEIASLLSFTLTDHSADQALLADAQAGLLSNPDVRETHVRRLFAESGSMWVTFFSRWLDITKVGQLSKDVTTYPNFDAALAAQMNDETAAFVKNVVVGASGTFTDLFTANYTWAAPSLAKLYGATSTGTGVTRIMLDPAQRSGLLTQGSWLTVHASPGDSSVEKRGAYVWRSLFCNGIAQPPPNVNEVLAMLVGSNATKQQKIDARASQPSCNGCHQYIDPIGVGLEKYDGIGVWRATPPVPTAAQIPGVGGFDGAVQLSQLVATQEATRNCFARRLAQFALGSDLDDPTKTDWMTAATSAFNAKQLEVQELVVGIVRHSAFIERHIVRE